MNPRIDCHGNHSIPRNIKERIYNHLLDGPVTALSGPGGLWGSLSALGIYDYFVETK